MDDNMYKKSQEIMSKSMDCFPGGVNSPVRSFQSVGGTPIVFSHGIGKTLYDVDNNPYIDFCSSWGPLILGYSHPKIVSAIQEQAARAISFGAPSELELKLALKIKEFVPQIELLRFVNSGTEATMSAVRAARAMTNKNKFVKFEGCYHGHGDQFLVKAGSGLATLGNPSSAGIPEGTTNETLTAIYNSEESVEEIFSQYGHDIAALIVEPVAANMGLVLPNPNFLKFLRNITEKYKTVLIFDEVMTGFRLAKGGCAELFGVVPDLWTFGKIIGGGLPAAAYGGKKEIMSQIAPLGKAYQAGTLSGNPLAMAAGLATLEEIENNSIYNKLEMIGQKLDEIVQHNLTQFMEKGLMSYSRIGSFFCFFFGSNKRPQNYQDVQKSDFKLFSKIYHDWLSNGIYLGPSGYEVGFLSACIEENDLKKLVQVVKNNLEN